MSGASTPPGKNLAIAGSSAPSSGPDQGSGPAVPLAPAHGPPDAAAIATAATARPGFLAELKRRKIPRAAVAYLIAASGVLQGLENVHNNFDLPHWLVVGVRSLVIVGFPVALVAAWFFDVAPARPGEEASHPRTRTTGAGARRFNPKKPTWAAIAVMALLVAAFTGWQLLGRGSGAASGRPEVQTVLIADFDNQTGEGVFDGTLELALAQALEGASFVAMYSRPSAFKVADEQKLPGTGLGEQRARLVAAREGIATVVAGRIERSGSETYAVHLHAVDGMTGKDIVKASSKAESKERVLAAVTKAAAHVRRALGDKTPESVQLAAGETFSASSLEAAHAYAVGMAHQFAGRWDDAIWSYQEALKLDPGMGRAYAGMAVIESNRNRRSEAVRWFQEAMGHVDRMTAREKYRTRGAYYLSIEHDADKAIEALTPLVKEYPADNAGLANLSVAYVLKRDFPRALEESKKAVAISPKNVPQRNNVGLNAMFLGDYDAAIREQQQCISLNPRFVNAYAGLALAQLASGRSDGAVATWERLRGVSDDGASAAIAGLADLALYEGRLSDARALLEKGIAADRASKDGDALARKLVMLGGIQLAHGEVAAAVASAQRAVEASEVEYVRFLAGGLAAEAGAEAKALAIAGDLDRKLSPEPRMYAEIVRGVVELKRKDYPAAVNRFRSAVQRLDVWIARFYLGRAYVEAGAFVHAQEELERCVKRRSEVTDVFLDVWPTYRLYPPVLYYLARAHEGTTGPAAGDWYAKFLATAKTEEAPLVVDARRRTAMVGR